MCLCVRVCPSDRTGKLTSITQGKHVLDEEPDKEQPKDPLFKVKTSGRCSS